MELVELKDGNKIPNICYGSSIINNNYYSFKGFIKTIIKTMLSNNRKDLRTTKGLNKILKYICKNVDCISIDTSRAYGYSESIIGRYLQKNKDSFYIITKVSNSDQYNGNIVSSVKQSLEKLNTNKIDLLLMHWPVEEKYIDTWKQMIEIKKMGLCKSIGVCNCNIHHLEKIKNETGELPVVNEIECHPLFTQVELREYCKKNNIKIMSYTSLARMDERLNKTCLPNIAKKYNKTVAQIILKWHISIDNIPIFNTSNLETFKKNINIFDFELTNDDINEISKININSRLRYDPDNCDFTKL